MTFKRMKQLEEIAKKTNIEIKTISDFTDFNKVIQTMEITSNIDNIIKVLNDTEFENNNIQKTI